MKKIALLAAIAAASAVVAAPSAHADALTADSTTTLSCTVPAALTFVSNGDVTYDALASSTTDATGKSISAKLTTNYHAISLSIKAGSDATGANKRKTALPTIVANDIVVKNNDASNASPVSVNLSTGGASFGTLSGFSPNTPKDYSFPVDVNNISQYEQGTYTNSVVITATGG